MYVTTADLDAEFGSVEMEQLLSRDDFAVDRAVEWGEGVANDYLNAAGVLVPVPTPKELVGYICDLARWRLYDDQITETVKLRYDAAIAWFTALVAGRIKPLWAITSSQGSSMAYSTPGGSAVSGFSRYG